MRILIKNKYTMKNSEKAKGFWKIFKKLNL